MQESSYESEGRQDPQPTDIESFVVQGPQVGERLTVPACNNKSILEQTGPDQREAILELSPIQLLEFRTYVRQRTGDFADLLTFVDGLLYERMPDLAEKPAEFIEFLQQSELHRRQDSGAWEYASYLISENLDKYSLYSLQAVLAITASYATPSIEVVKAYAQMHREEGACSLHPDPLISKLPIHDSEYFRALLPKDANLTECLERLSHFNISDVPLDEAFRKGLASALRHWSFSNAIELFRSIDKVSRVDVRMLDAIANRIDELSPHTSTQNLCDLLSISSRCRHRAARFLMERLERRLRMRLDEQPETLGIDSTVTILKSLSLRKDELMPSTRGFEQHLELKIRHMNLPQIARLLAYKRRMNSAHDTFFKSLVKGAEERLNLSAHPRDVCIALYACAVMRYEESTAPAKFAQWLVDYPGHFGSRTISKAMYAVAMLNPQNAAEIFDSLLEKLRSCHWANCDDIAKEQVLRSALFLDKKVPELESFASEINRRVCTNARPSGFEVEVKTYLDQLGVNYRQQVNVYGYVVDFLVTLDGKPVVFECDGVNFHNVGGDADEPLRGPGKLRDAIFRKLGVRTIRYQDREHYLSEDPKALIAQRLGVSDKDNRST